VKVELNNVSKVFRAGVVAVDRVTLDVTDGEFMVLLGASGSGKSTMLRLIAGLEVATSGDVLLDGAPVGAIRPRDRKVAMIFQELALFRHFSVRDNIGFPLRVAGVDPASREKQVRSVADALGIGDLLDRRPHQLSGGQRQRVAMGRAMVRRPRLFLMDEPLSNLDLARRGELRAEIANLVRELGVTCIYVTHDQAEALTLADRVAVLRRGVLQDVGKPADVYGRPATLYVAGFLGSPRMNLVEASVTVALDRHVALQVGSQQLHLEWGDLRARMVAHYHGERIVLGIRSEAMIPVPATATGNVLHGRIRQLEHHGHESVAFVDVGATAVEVDTPPALLEQSPAGPGGLRRFARRLTGRRPADNRAVATGHTGRHHRRPAELSVRLAPYPAVDPGHPMSLEVSVDSLQFFERSGDRIDVGRRY
jgi:multiple sugar transport system ATP-binding protein